MKLQNHENYFKTQIIFLIILLTLLYFYFKKHQNECPTAVENLGMIKNRPHFYIKPQALKTTHNYEVNYNTLSLTLFNSVVFIE